ncbi:uncharacterized protein Dmoj_GI13242 [Drosophila mojavensis]|uniref:Uncharacterized protein n=1 Tax=Drosophila mojavensis TaxID=7230 RepID=B4KVS8_DROMO|nr:uncharacterized protein Dmoj_GI13242 [Drosophila mojavensis]
MPEGRLEAATWQQQAAGIKIPATLKLALWLVLKSRLARFTNVECEMLDPSFATFEQCELKVLGRGIIGLNIYAKLNKGPFNNAKINISLWRKFNGYRPFIFNKTLDFCNFMKKTNEKLSYEKIFLDIINAIIVKDLIIQADFFKFMPLPTGQYKFQLKAATDKQWKTIVKTFFTFSEEQLKI